MVAPDIHSEIVDGIVTATYSRSVRYTIVGLSLCNSFFPQCIHDECCFSYSATCCSTKVRWVVWSKVFACARLSPKFSGCRTLRSICTTSWTTWSPLSDSTTSWIFIFTLLSARITLMSYPHWRIAVNADLLVGGQSDSDELIARSVVRLLVPYPVQQLHPLALWRNVLTYPKLDILALPS